VKDPSVRWTQKIKFLKAGLELMKSANNYVNRNSVELYKVIEDLYQLHMLAVDSLFVPVLKKFNNKLKEFMLQQRDNGNEIAAMAEKIQNSHN
jgi:hypothetical protein